MGQVAAIDRTTKLAIMDLVERLVKPGEINLGWNDVKTVLLQDGETMISFGSGTGQHRAFKACADALASFRTDTMAKTAAKVLFHLTGPENLLLAEVNGAIDIIKRKVWPSGEPIFGVTRDSSLKGEVRCILLTTREKKWGSRVNERAYSPAEQDLIYDWSHNWLQLIELINNVTGPGQPPSSPLPTELEELEYQRLRFWLIDHQAQFTPLWIEFYQSHDWAYAKSVPNQPDDFPPKYSDNHFLYFYEPEDLYKLAQQLGLQSGVDIWEPNENGASMIRPLLIRLGQLMIEFMDWMDERAREPG